MNIVDETKKLHSIVDVDTLQIYVARTASNSFAKNFFCSVFTRTAHRPGYARLARATDEWSVVQQNEATTIANPDFFNKTEDEEDDDQSS